MAVGVGLEDRVAELLDVPVLVDEGVLLDERQSCLASRYASPSRWT